MIKVDDLLPMLEVQFTRETLVRYAGASGDFNPIHYSDYAAKELGLPGVLAHGMLTCGTALRVVTDWIGDPARVISYSTRFTKPVFVPDDGIGITVRFEGVVKSVTDDVAKISVTAVVGETKVLGSTTVEVSCV